MKFGEKLKILRILGGFTQAQIAEEAGMQQSSITRHEKGTAVPYSGPLSKIVEVLDQGKNVAWLQGKGSYKNPPLVIYKPLSPYQEYTSLMIRSIDQALAELLPVYVEEIGLFPRLVLKSGFGSIFYATDDSGSHCLVVACRSEITEALYAGFPDLSKADKIADDKMLRILLFSDLDAIAAYTQLNNSALDAYKHQYATLPASKMKQTVNIKLEGSNISSEIVSEIHEYIKKLLIENKIEDARVHIEREPVAGGNVESLIDAKILKQMSAVDLKIENNTVKKIGVL